MHHSPSPASDRELLSLISDYCQGKLNATDLARLEACLTANPAAQQQYVEYLDLHLTLRKLAKQGGILGDVPPGHVVLSLSSWQRMASFRRISPIAATLCVATIIYSAFGLLVWQMSQMTGGSRAQTLTSVATLIDDAGCEWQRRDLTKSFTSAEPLLLQSGTAHLQMASGVEIRVTGPAELSLQPNAVELREGVVTAQVPQSAIGFAVQTPTALVVDLGTEFGVETDRAGNTNVQVFRGMVELRAANLPIVGQLAQVVTLKAGEGRRVEAAADGKSVSLRELASTETKLASKAQLASAARKPIRIHGAVASSQPTLRVHDPKYLIDGRGLHDGQHTNDEFESMWCSKPGDVRGQFVLFDLGRPYRLEEAKVWNYNEARYDSYRTSGVKQADLYVSTSGKGDPTSKPAEWLLVAENHSFQPATGKSDYAAADTVALSGAIGRFVAIVIDEAWRASSMAPTPLIRFAGPEKAVYDDGKFSAGMYGSEIQTPDRPLTVAALGGWIGEKYRTGNQTSVEYTAVLYALDGDQFTLVRRAVIPRGTEVDGDGFAFAPTVLTLKPNAKYVIVSYLGEGTVGHTPYVGDVRNGVFAQGAKFTSTRYAFTSDPSTLPRSRSEDSNFKLGVLLGGNLLVTPTSGADSPGATPQSVGLSEVQFFGTRIEDRSNQSTK